MNFSKFRTPLEIAGLSGGVGASALAIQYSQERNIVNEENKKFKEENRELINDVSDLKESNMNLELEVKESGETIDKKVKVMKEVIHMFEDKIGVYEDADPNHDLIKAMKKAVEKLKLMSE